MDGLICWSCCIGPYSKGNYPLTGKVILIGFVYDLVMLFYGLGDFLENDIDGIGA